MQACQLGLCQPRLKSRYPRFKRFDALHKQWNKPCILHGFHAGDSIGLHDFWHDCFDVLREKTEMATRAKILLLAIGHPFQLEDFAESYFGANRDDVFLKPPVTRFCDRSMRDDARAHLQLGYPSNGAALDAGV
mmetsp:Transcript_310/g.995  ORF Transcript_310/g.995 Transcript_310/m.995 type:complete len:134 (+) Transcript_310:326-727(+)